MKAEVTTLIQTFFEKLGVEMSSIEVLQDEAHIYTVQIQTEDSGILIGPHGKNLDALQGILRLMTSHLCDQKIRIHLKINDYQDDKDERLYKFIRSKIELVKKKGENIGLPFYNAYERKKIHSFIADLNDESIFTQSIGEGKDRRLHICKKSEKMTIDIDGDDI